MKITTLSKAASLTGLVAVFAILTASPGASSTRGALLQRIDQIVEDAMAKDKVPGTSVAVVKNGELILARGYGLADVENQVPANEHTVYRIGSVTKQFAAAAILKLVEAGKVDLEAPARTYLPDYPWGDFNITVRQLLNHTSGIKGYTEMPEFWEKSRLDLSHSEMIELISSAPLEFEPGDRNQYSNSAYYLAGLIVEKVTGKRWADYIEEEIFAPLGMRNSHYLYNDPIVPGRAEGYRHSEDGELLNDDPLSMYLPFSAGSLGSSVFDLARWVKALTSGEVLSQESFAQMTTSGKLNNGESHGRGLGLMISELSGHRKIEHAGGINGFLSQMAWYPDDDLVIAVLCNSTPSAPGVVEARIARAVLGEPEPRYTTVKLSDEELERYAGTYNPGRSPMTVTVEGGRLRMNGSFLIPIGDHRFVGENDPDQIVAFTLEGDKAQALQSERWGHVTRAARTDG